KAFVFRNCFWNVAILAKRLNWKQRIIESLFAQPDRPDRIGRAHFGPWQSAEMMNCLIKELENYHDKPTFWSSLTARLLFVDAMRLFWPRSDKDTHRSTCEPANP